VPDEIQPAGDEVVWGNRPRSTPVKRCTQFEEKEGSGLTGAASPRWRSRSRGARWWSAGEEVEGAGEVVDEHRGVEGEIIVVENEPEDGRSGRSSMMCTSRPSRYVSLINDNHLVSLINFNAAKVD
jgi:hypothetical protein